MGRLATDLAAAATMADNLPQKLPRVSVFDALLPRSITSPSKPLGTPPENISPGVGDHEIRKNKRGKMFMVHHKGSSSRTGSAVEIADGKDGGKVSTKDVKKTKGGGDGKNDQAKADEKKSGADENQAGFTDEEDAKLTELKTAGKASKSWKEIAEEMGRSQPELKERWKVINPNAQGDGKGGQEGQGKGAKQNDEGGKQKQGGNGGDQKKSNDDQNKGGNNQQGDGKKGKGKNKEWTSDEDAKLKEMWAADKPWNDLQAEFHCGKNVIEARWKEVGDGKEPAKQDSNNKKPDPNAPWTDEEDKLLKELWEKEASWKDLKKELHRSKPAIEDRWKVISKADEPKKPEEPKKEETKKTPSAKAPSAKAASVVSKARSHRSEARFTMGEWMTLQEDELFTFQELQLLSHIIMRDPSQSWLRVASSFHDKTGRRVHPDDIREKFEAMAAMG